MHLQPFTGRQRQNRRNNCSSTDVAVLANHSVEIPTTDARRCIRFQLVPSGTGQAIVVESVAEGSSAQQAGVKVGMKLSGISDPVRRDEVWQLQDRPSLRYVRDVLRMRANAYIQLQFEPAQPERDDNGFLAVVAASFVLPALIILLVAYSTGYLDNLYSTSLSNFR
eukprot:gene13099-13228_t